MVFTSISCLRLCMFTFAESHLYDASRLTVVSREAKEEVPCDGLSTNACEYFTRTNLVKIKNDKSFTLAH